MTMHLKNATVLITGGSSGIGFELARQLLAKGNTVIVAGRNQASLDRAKQLDPRLTVFNCDVSDPGSVSALYSQIAERFPRLDVLVNSAGQMRKIDLRRNRAMHDLVAEIDANLKGTIWMVAQFLPMLQRQDQAAIVNVSSALAFVPMAISPVYSASKAGVRAYTQALRGQLASTNVQVFELAPPATETELHMGEDFTSKDTGGAAPMKVEDLVTATIAAIEQNRLEIRPGSAGLLKTLGRIAPDFAFRQVNSGSLALMAEAHA
jgi:uncharacterized oxidoreductase